MIAQRWEEAEVTVDEQRQASVTEQLADQVEAWAYCADGVVALAADVIVHDPGDEGAVAILLEASEIRARIKALARKLAAPFRGFGE